MKTIIIAFIVAGLAAGQLASPAQAGHPVVEGYCNETYIVRRGDSLGRIARRCEITLDQLLFANPGLTAADIIYPGQVLRIVPEAQIVPLPDSHIVRPGESLGIIAERYDTTVRELLRLNPDILNPRIIYAGQELRLPGNFSGPRIFLSTTTVKPGWYIEVKLVDFPPNADIDFLLSKEGGPYTPVQDNRTDASGSLSAYVSFPNTAVVGEEWTIQVQTTETAELVRVSSQTVTIVK